jgi:hypothetical protein
MFPNFMYFQFSPVLTTLQQIDVNKYELKNEIVFAQPSQIESSQQVSFNDPEIRQIYQDFDGSQQQAFFHALKNRLAIIQGPPGSFLDFCSSIRKDMYCT